jgi:hypothetical protein
VLCNLNDNFYQLAACERRHFAVVAVKLFSEFIVGDRLQTRIARYGSFCIAHNRMAIDIKSPPSVSVEGKTMQKILAFKLYRSMRIS